MERLLLIVNIRNLVGFKDVYARRLSRSSSKRLSIDSLKSESSIDKLEKLNHSRDETLTNVGGCDAKASSSALIVVIVGRVTESDLVRRANEGFNEDENKSSSKEAMGVDCVLVLRGRGCGDKDLSDKRVHKEVAVVEDMSDSESRRRNIFRCCLFLARFAALTTLF